MATARTWQVTMAACVGSASEAAQHECDWYRALTSWQVDVAPKAAEARQSMVMGVRRRRLECDRAAAKGTAVGRPGGGFCGPMWKIT